MDTALTAPQPPASVAGGRPRQESLASGDAARRLWYQTATRGQSPPPPDAELLAEVGELRDAMRQEAYGETRVGQIASYIEMYWGWPTVSGVHVDAADEAIALHSWNLLPGDAILDVSADCFGEGLDIAVITPDDPQWRRYRQEWTIHHNPDAPGMPAELAAAAWSGTPDMATLQARRARHGDEPWWLDNHASPAFSAFREKIAEMGASGSVMPR